jgi:hypothetical protein
MAKLEIGRGDCYYVNGDISNGVCEHCSLRNGNGVKPYCEHRGGQNRIPSDTISTEELQSLEATLPCCNGNGEKFSWFR